MIVATRYKKCNLQFFLSISLVMSTPQTPFVVSSLPPLVSNFPGAIRYFG